MKQVVAKLVNTGVSVSTNYWDIQDLQSKIMKDFLARNKYTITGTKQLVKIKKTADMYAKLIIHHLIDPSTY